MVLWVGGAPRSWPGARARPAGDDARRSRVAQGRRHARRHYRLARPSGRIPTHESRIPSMMRAYIVDDEKLAIVRLTRLLDVTRRVTIAGSSTDPEEALAFLRTHDVDVLFL